MSFSLPTNAKLLELAGGVRDLSDYIAGDRVARPRIVKDRIASLTHEHGPDGRITEGKWQRFYSAIVHGLNKGEIPQRERKRCEDLRDALEKTLDSLGLAFRAFDEPPSIRRGLLAQAQEALRGAADWLQRIAGRQAATATASAGDPNERKLTSRMATIEFCCSRATIKRRVASGYLHPIRPPNAPKNATHRFMEQELAEQFDPRLAR